MRHPETQVGETMVTLPLVLATVKIKSENA